MKVRLGNTYMARLQHAATKDAKVTEGFMRVVGLLDPPAALMRPRMLFRILRHAGRSAGADGFRPAPNRSPDVVGTGSQPLA